MNKLLIEFLNIIQNNGYKEDNNFRDLDGIKNISHTFDEIFENCKFRYNINFFPSDKHGPCRETAVFVSFHKPILNLKFKKNQMIPLEEVLKKVVQQVLGTCYPKNQSILLITDKIDTGIFEPWVSNFRVMINMGIEIDIIYLKSDGKYENINKLLNL